MAADQSKTVDKTEKPKKAETLNPAETYSIAGTGKNRHLKKGVEYSEPGDMAQLLIDKGFATLK